MPPLQSAARSGRPPSPRFPPPLLLPDIHPKGEIFNSQLRLFNFFFSGRRINLSPVDVQNISPRRSSSDDDVINVDEATYSFGPWFQY